MSDKILITPRYIQTSITSRHATLEKRGQVVASLRLGLGLVGIRMRLGCPARVYKLVADGCIVGRRLGNFQRWALGI